MELPPILAIIGSYFAMAGGVWALFDRADKAIKEETKIAVSLWLIESNPTAGNSKWPGQFITIFDSVFGEKHGSWRCFFRSCVASFIAITILLLVYLGIRGPEGFISFGGQSDWYNKLLIIYIVGAILNLLPDYVSLLETRYILKWMSRSHSFLKIFGLLCLDLVVSSLLFIGGYVLIISLQKPPYEAISVVMEQIIRGLSFSGVVDGDVGIFFYSTFFTSVWIWLYGLSGLFIKVTNKMGKALNWLKNILDFENKPLPSLGFVSNLIILFIYLIGFGLFYEGAYL